MTRALQLLVGATLTLAVGLGASAAEDVEPGTPASAYVEGLVRSLEQQDAAVREIRLEDAIATAIRNNPGITADRREPQATREGVLEAAAAYEPAVRIDAQLAESKTPTGDALAGGGAARTLDQDQYRADFAVSKQFRSGTQLEVRWENVRRTSTSEFQQLRPRFDPTLGVTLEQPILNDFNGIRARTSVLVARNASRQAVARFEARLGDFVTDVVDAYWGYTLAEAELDVRRHSLELARELASDTRARVDIGTLPPVAYREALADAASREEEAISAENERDLAARTLQYMVMLGASGGGAPYSIRPAERHEVEAIPLNRAASLRVAVERRGEVRAAQFDVDNARLTERRARNELLPDLSLVGNYTLVGLGGRPVTGAPGSPATAEDRARKSEREAYGDALDLLTSGDFFSYSVGLQLDVPLSNATARAGHTRAVIELRRSEDALRQVVSDIALQVDDAVGDVASAYKRAAAAKLARELAEENLENQHKRYEVGIVTTTDVLDFQEKLASAMAAEARAIADHAVAIARLRRAEGRLLEQYDVSVRFEDEPELEWWARF